MKIIGIKLKNIDEIINELQSDDYKIFGDILFASPDKIELFKTNFENYIDDNYISIKLKYDTVDNALSALESIEDCFGSEIFSNDNILEMSGLEQIIIPIYNKLKENTDAEEILE